MLSHGYDRLGGAWMEVVVGMHAGQSLEGLVAYREISEQYQSAR